MYCTVQYSKGRIACSYYIVAVHSSPDVHSKYRCNVTPSRSRVLSIPTYFSQLDPVSAFCASQSSWHQNWKDAQHILSKNITKLKEKFEAKPIASNNLMLRAHL